MAKINKPESKIFDRIGIVVAIIISITSLVYTYTKDRNDDKELISVIYTAYGNNESELFEEVPFQALNITSAVGFNYGVIIANNSKKRISIVDLDIKQIAENSVFSFGGQFEGLYDGDLKKIRMPLILDSGESKPVIIRIKAGLSKKVTDIIKEKYKLPMIIDFKKVRKELEEKSIDVFSNDVIIKTIGESKIITINNPKYPSYLLTLTTSNNTLFREIISIDKYGK